MCVVVDVGAAGGAFVVGPLVVGAVVFAAVVGAAIGVVVVEVVEVVEVVVVVVVVEKSWKVMGLSGVPDKRTSVCSCDA